MCMCGFSTNNIILYIYFLQRSPYQIIVGIFITFLSHGAVLYIDLIPYFLIPYGFRKVLDLWFCVYMYVCNYIKIL